MEIAHICDTRDGNSKTNNKSTKKYACIGGQEKKTGGTKDENKISS